MLDPKEALGKVTKKKHVSAANSRNKKKTQPGKQNKTSAKRGAQNVELDLLDDDDDDGNKIVGKPNVDDDKDDTSDHDNGEDSDSDSEPSMPPDSDIETEEAVVDNDHT